MYTHDVFNLGVITHICTSSLLYPQSKNTQHSGAMLAFFLNRIKQI